MRQMASLELILLHVVDNKGEVWVVVQKNEKKILSGYCGSLSLDCTKQTWLLLEMQITSLFYYIFCRVLR